MKTAILALVLAGAISAASATMTDRSYDGAVNCKGISLLASRTDYPKSKAALKAIDAAIEAGITDGRTREQADADVEYSRFEWHDTMSQETIDVEWVACVERWTD